MLLQPHSTRQVRSVGIYLYPAPFRCTEFREDVDVDALRAAFANEHHQRDKKAFATSDPFYPSPWMSPDADGWKEAYVQAKNFVSQMTLLEKVNLTTGVG